MAKINPSDVGSLLIKALKADKVLKEQKVTFEMTFNENEIHLQSSSCHMLSEPRIISRICGACTINDLYCQDTSEDDIKKDYGYDANNCKTRKLEIYLASKPHPFMTMKSTFKYSKIQI